MHNTENSQLQTKTKLYISPFSLFILGLRVIGSELRWNMLRLIRSWEIKQLQKRLRQEYELLGQLEARESETELSSQQSAEKELCHKQIEFLQQEIIFLEQALKRTRSEYIAKRLSSWNLEH